MSSNDMQTWTPIGTAKERDSLTDVSLVLTALAIDHRFEHTDQVWQLQVQAENAQWARAELQRYQHENRPLSAPPREPRVMERGWVGIAGFLAVIWLLPTLETSQVFSWDWRARGAMHAEAVMNGQWWRTFTALTLHSGLPHLLGNSLFGVAFGVFLGRHMGSGFGWLLVLLAGAAGNGANAFVQADEFRSIGASTATFGALGLGATFFWRQGYLRNRSWKRNFAPVIAGITLLAFTGVGGENTDVAAHFLGFAAGAALGLGAASFDLRRLGKSGQYLSGVLTMGLLITTWYLAGTS